MKFEKLKKFFNKADERIFNDMLINVIFIEIALKIKEINENLILPRYRNKSVTYEGETYQYSGKIKDIVSNEILSEIKELIINGSAIDFKTKTEIKTWIGRTTGISDCSISNVI